MTETTEATVKKVWNDSNDQDGKRPAELTVNLMNGNTVVRTVTLNAGNNWTAKVTGLARRLTEPISHTAGVRKHADRLQPD
ncbi:MAG: Cna B-type domain-containing protein [Blautia faecis]